MIEATWATVKDFIDNRNISPQYIIEGGAYLIRVADNYFQLSVKLIIGKNDVEIQEFLDDYLDTSNLTPKQVIVRNLGQDNISLSPRVVFITAIGITDKKLLSTTGLLSIRGAALWVDKADWDYTDSIAFSIIDKDDVLGLGGTPSDPTVVFNFIPKNSSSKGECGIAPNMWNELMDESISDSIPDGLYARIEYIKDSGIKIPKAIMNIVSYEV